jgi:hypothetical protein
MDNHIMVEALQSMETEQAYLNGNAPDNKPKDEFECESSNQQRVYVGV